MGQSLVDYVWLEALASLATTMESFMVGRPPVSTLIEDM